MSTDITMPTCPQIESGLVGTLLQYPMQVVPMLVGARVDAGSCFAGGRPGNLPTGSR